MFFRFSSVISLMTSAGAEVFVQMPIGPLFPSVGKRSNASTTGKPAIFADPAVADTSTPQVSSQTFAGFEDLFCIGIGVVFSP